MTWLAFVMLSVVVYRVTVFVELDTMFEDSRDRLFLWLDQKRKATKGARSLIYRKLHDGLSCAYCVSVWIAGGAVLFWAAATPYELDWTSLVDWIAIAGGALMFYRFTDPAD